MAKKIKLDITIDIELAEKLKALAQEDFLPLSTYLNRKLWKMLRLLQEIKRQENEED